MVPVIRYSTSDLPPDARYLDWYYRGWPGQTPLLRSKPMEPFDVRWERVQLGLVTFVYVEITSMTWERRLDDIRTSSSDPLVISMMIDGLAEGDMDGRAFREGSGTYHFNDMARPSLHGSTGSRTYNLSIPRAVAGEWLAPLRDLHGLVIEQQEARILFAIAEQVHASIDRLGEDGAERLGRVFLELLAAAIAGRRPTQPDMTSALRRRAVKAIDQSLGGKDASVEGLCRMLNVSRGRLFKLFQPDGGIQAYVMTQRLTRARAALAEIDRAEPVGTLADRLGFADASHLSRAFKKRFGVTPRDYRALILENRRRLAKVPDETLVLEAGTDVLPEIG